MKEYKVLFCDMDGTLIETVSGETFPKGIWDMKFKFDVLDAIKRLTKFLQKEKMFMYIQTIKVINRLNALIVFDYGSKERNNNRRSAT